MFGRNVSNKAISPVHATCRAMAIRNSSVEIDRRVTRRLRNLIKMSELANPKFVEDFSRLFASP